MKRQLFRVNPYITYCQIRRCERKHTKQNFPAPPTETTSDWIGPPDSSSNLRPTKIHIPSDETRAELQHRQLRLETEKWNQTFWRKHNVAFFQERKTFVEAMKKEKISQGGSTEQNVSLSPEELSVFYKKFLDDNYEAHMNYNKEWYKRNIGMLLPAFLASLNKIKRKFKHRLK